MGDINDPAKQGKARTRKPSSQMGWALHRKGLSPIEKLVLVTLADRSDADGWSFYAQQTIADICNVTRKTVRVALQRLEGEKLIVRNPVSLGNLRTSDHIRIAYPPLGN